MRNKGILMDPLFVGCTRPAMKCGVTYHAFLVNAVVTMETFIITHNLLYLPIFFPIHGIFYLICWYDPRAFELLFFWAQTKGAALVFGNTRYWKATSYSPLELE